MIFFLFLLSIYQKVFFKTLDNTTVLWYIKIYKRRKQHVNLKHT